MTRTTTSNATTAHTSPDWIEAKTARMVAVVRRSEFKRSILNDARDFEADGYAWDVALAMSLRYWEGNPVTGRTPGVDY